MEKTKKRSLIVKLVIVAAAVLAAVIVLSDVFVVVDAGHTGVVMTLGKVSENVLSEGLHVKAPFVQNVHVMSNKIQMLQVDAAAVSKDLQSVSSSVAVNYRIGSNASAKVYQNIGVDYQNVVLLPAIQESMKSVSASYTAEELITLRAQVGEAIKETLESKVSEYGIVIEKFNIVNFDFSAEFNAAIEAKQVAEQNLIKVQTEQQQALVIAEAEAKKKLIAAEAEASATLKKAEAQAEANRLIAQSLTQQVLEAQKIEKWDGKLPLATDGSAILDVRSEQ